MIKPHPCSDEANAPQWPNLETQQRAPAPAQAQHSPAPYYMVSSDDGEERQPLFAGDKIGVIETLLQYEPMTTRVTEYTDDSDVSEIVQSLNGEEWLERNTCPICLSALATTPNAQRLADAARKVEAHSYHSKFMDRDDHYVVDVEAMDSLCKALADWKAAQ